MLDEQKTPSKIDLQYTEHKVVFLISDCSTNKDFSFWKLQRVQAENLITRLRHFEQMNWAQFSNLPRENGITQEKPGTKSFEMIHEKNTSAEKITEQYYFHFRVKQGDLFRVFGYQKKQFFCITHLDRDGSVHH